MYQLVILLSHVQERLGQPGHYKKQTTGQRLSGCFVLSPLDVLAPLTENLYAAVVSKEIQFFNLLIFFVVSQPLVQLAKLVFRVAPVGDSMPANCVVLMLVDFAERNFTANKCHFKIMIPKTFKYLSYRNK